jgi:hypothetical protein
MQVWESATNDRSLSVNIANAPGTSFTREALPGGTDRYYWIRAVDRSGNRSGFYPASDTAGIHARTRKVEEADYADLSIGNAAIANAAIDDAKISSLDASKIIAGSILSGSVMVNGQYRLDTALDANGNPAAAINSGTTLIDPGKILISGATRLSDWRSGGDNTQIQGGAIAANSIKANSLTIGNRQVEFVGMTFEADKLTQIVTWTAGFAIWQGDDGTTKTQNIPASAVQYVPASGTLFLCFSPGRPGIDWTYASNIYANPAFVVIGQYTGGSNLIMTYGRTKIDGDFIRTGTVTANNIAARQINASHLSVSEVLIANQAQIGFGAITDFHFGTGKIDGARITSLTAGQITSGPLGATFIQVGSPDKFDQGLSCIDIDGRPDGPGSKKVIRFWDQNHVKRVEIGQPTGIPDPAVDGLIVRDRNNKVILHANGFGVQVVGTDNITGGAVTTARFEISHTLGTNSIAGGTIHIVVYMSANIGYDTANSSAVTQRIPQYSSMSVRVVLNGSAFEPFTMGGVGGTYVSAPVVILIAPGAGSPVTVQAQMETGTGWQAFGGDPVPGRVVGLKCQISAIEYKR